jgi:DNA-directed RNA polymerase specialized sigma24 family protein
MGKHNVLGQPDLDALLASLAANRDEAGEAYEFIRQRLLRYFEGHHCVPADQYVDETIDRVARRLAAGEQIRSADPCRYFYGVARNVTLESRRQQALRQRPRQTPMSLDAAPSQRLSCLNYCLSALSPQDRELLEAYYLDCRTGMAAQLDVTPNALRLKVFKAKRKLRACIACCLQPHRS